MFGTSRLFILLAGAVGTLVVAALLVFAGFRAGEQRIRSQWDTERAASADAFALLAHRYTVADAEAERLRAAAEAVATQRVTEIRREIVKIPVRVGCGHSDDEYRVLLDTYCVRYPTAPACVHDPVRDAAPADPGPG